MPTKTFYLLNTAATTPDWFGSLQDGGSAPAAAASAFGWTVAKTATSTPFWRGRFGATATATAAQAASYIDASSGPTKGTGATNTTAGDSFRSPTAVNGSFVAGNWTLSFGMRTGAATHSGRIRCRVWASTNSDGTSPRQLTTGALVGSTITLNATNTTFTTSVTWAAPAITLSNEYLFFQLEWNTTTAGTSNSCSALFYQSAGSVVTTDFTASAATAALTLTQAAQTISAAVSVTVAGTLSQTQAAHTLSATGTVSGLVVSPLPQVMIAN